MDIAWKELNKNVAHPHSKIENEDGMKFIKLAFKN